MVLAADTDLHAVAAEVGRLGEIEGFARGLASGVAPRPRWIPGPGQYDVSADQLGQAFDDRVEAVARERRIAELAMHHERLLKSRVLLGQLLIEPRVGNRDCGL